MKVQIHHPLTENAKALLERRYIHKELGETEWLDVVKRVVDYIIDDEDDRWLYYQLIGNRYFVPNSPTLVNAGTAVKGLSACYVVPMGDSIESIHHAKYAFAKICQKGGGAGVSLSELRPRGSNVAGSTHAIASGPVSFFSTICYDMSKMTQSAFRDMAIMGTLRVDHPDIMEFIAAKEIEGALHNTNMSVVVPNHFMQWVEEEYKKGKTAYDFALHWDGEVCGYIPVKVLWDAIVDHAWANGEPGVLFEFAMNTGPYSETGQWLTATNPCGEQPLPPWGVCCLGSIDVSKYHKAGLTTDHWTERFNWEGFIQDVQFSVRFLDKVLDKSEWPMPEIARWVEENRPIGLGIMGLADLFLMYGVEYGGPVSIEITRKIMETLLKTAYNESARLAEELGVPKRLQEMLYPRRNVTLVSVAPTGSIATIAGCSHGIEPIFAPSVKRVDESGVYDISSEASDKFFFRSAINDDPEKVVTWKQHIDIQAAVQEFTDSGVSKTINLPNDATREDVAQAILYAWRMGCKGITVYRDGSRDKQVLNVKTKLDFEDGPVTVEERPRVLESRTVKLANGDKGNVYITVGYDKGRPIEVFVNGPSILLPDVQMRDGFSRLSSLILRAGVPIERLVKELRQIQATSLHSVPTQIAAVLEELEIGDKCPNCNANIQFLEGCRVCVMCGYSHCS